MNLILDKLLKEALSGREERSIFLLALQKIKNAD